MKKLLFIFLFITGFAFGQQKPLFKAVSYHDLIEFYNQKLNLKNEDLAGNIDRCKFIIEDARKKNDYHTELAFGIILKGLLEAQKKEDKKAAFISVYEDPTRYEFFDAQNRFAGSVYKEKLDSQIKANGNNTELYLQNYFYILQD